MIISRAFPPLLVCFLLGAVAVASAEEIRPSCAFAKAACGYVDNAGNVIIPPAFDAASPFVAGLAVVMIGGKFGIIDTHGAFIASAEYEGAATFDDGTALLYQNGVSRLIDHTGKVSCGRARAYGARHRGWEKGVTTG
jgi:hypothetical protein